MDIDGKGSSWRHCCKGRSLVTHVALFTLSTAMFSALFSLLCQFLLCQFQSTYSVFVIRNWKNTNFVPIVPKWPSVTKRDLGEPAGTEFLLIHEIRLSVILKNYQDTCLKLYQFFVEDNYHRCTSSHYLHLLLMWIILLLCSYSYKLFNSHWILSFMLNCNWGQIAPNCYYVLL